MSNFETIYAEATPQLREELKVFRASHPMQQVTIADHQWEYTYGGKGDEVVLLLVGGLRVADAGFRSISIMEEDFRVLAVTYPPLATMKQLADGLDAVLQHEGIEQAHVLAGSFGGMLAQVFVRQHPSRVKRLLLSTTSAPNEETAQKYQQELGFIEPLPEEMIREGAKQRFFDLIAPLPEEATFWKAYLEELFTQRLGKADLISTYQCLIDYMNNYTFSADDLAGRSSDILILASDDDPTFDAEAIITIYPHAHIHTFVGAGHSPGTTQRELYFQIVKDFLRGVAT